MDREAPPPTFGILPQFAGKLGQLCQSACELGEGVAGLALPEFPGDCRDHPL
jgi:hypothetical protein